MARLLKHSQAADTKLVYGGDESSTIPVHSCVIAARSEVLASMITPLEEQRKSEEIKDELSENATSSDESESSDVCLNDSTD